MKTLDAILLRFGLVRAARYDNLYACYKDVWGWWEDCVTGRKCKCPRCG